MVYKKEEHDAPLFANIHIRYYFLRLRDKPKPASMVSNVGSIPEFGVTQGGKPPPSLLPE